MIYGFDEDHVSILSSEQVLSQHNAILSAAYERMEDPVKAPGDMVRVDVTFDYPEQLPKPRMALVLRPVDEKRSIIWFYLHHESPGQEHGPFPSGDYEVSPIAPGFAPEPARIPVTIGEGTVPRAAFSMKPRGCLKGYVVSPNRGGRQAGEYLAPDTDVQIQSVTLSGGDVTRTLTPLQEEEAISDLDRYLSGTDYTTKGAFCFYGLPAGEYELIMNAEGYEPYSETRTVRPGQYGDELTIELVPETDFRP